MYGKVTMRDVFVYLLSGLAFLIALISADYNWCLSNRYLFASIFKGNTAVITFAILTVLYFAGHIIHSLDTVLYGVAKVVWKRKKSSKGMYFFYFIIAGHRVSGNINLRNKRSEFIEQTYNELELLSKSKHSEYFYIMNDLFKGLTLIALLFVGYTLKDFRIVACFIYLSLLLLFWYRARYYANSFIDTVESTRAALDRIGLQNIKDK